MVNEHHFSAASCPLHNQTGPDAVIGFAALIAELPYELRAAFEAERATLRAELASYDGSLAVAGADLDAPFTYVLAR
jgi:hypothetical protein